MKRVIIPLLILLLLAPAAYGATDYIKLYQEALQEAQRWQDVAFELSVQLEAERERTRRALELHAEAEADIDRLQEEIERLAGVIVDRDRMIQAQHEQIQGLLAKERFGWLLGGIVAGAAGALAVTSGK